MHKKYLGENVGKYVQLRAIAVHLDENDSERNSWASSSTESDNVFPLAPR